MKTENYTDLLQQVATKVAIPMTDMLALRPIFQAAARYELVRTLSAQRFTELFTANIKTRQRFDDLVEELVTERHLAKLEMSLPSAVGVHSTAKNATPPTELTALEDNAHYWFRQKVEKVWRTAYVGLDPDNGQWLHLAGCAPWDVATMTLSCFDWVKIEPPQ